MFRNSEFSMKFSRSSVRSNEVAMSVKQGIE